MTYTLKDCRTGKEAIYLTTLSIAEEKDTLFFRFEAHHSTFNCPFLGYNGAHSSGDACEILIGSDPNRNEYFEIEISPNNDLMIGKVQYCNEDENGPIIKVNLIDDCFVQSSVKKQKDTYIANLSFQKSKIMTGNGPIFFNAYRLETDGEETDRHLMALNPTMRGKFHTPSCFIFLSDIINKTSNSLNL